jgi:hypothetical protein
MKPDRPAWRIPDDLSALIAADEDLTWITHDWAPIELSVMAGTTYADRDIPLAWQIEFEPSAPAFREANSKIAAMGLEPDGYGWSTLIDSVMRKYHSALADELHYGDAEVSACVVWTESEVTCRHLVEVVWTLIYG